MLLALRFCTVLYFSIFFPNASLISLLPQQLFQLFAKVSRSCRALRISPESSQRACLWPQPSAIPSTLSKPSVQKSTKLRTSHRARTDNDNKWQQQVLFYRNYERISMTPVNEKVSSGKKRPDRQRLNHTDIAQPQASTSTEYSEPFHTFSMFITLCPHHTLLSRKRVVLHLAIGRSISSLCSKASNFRRSRSSAAASTLSAQLRHVCSTKSWWNFQGLIVFETPSKTFFQKFAGHPETFRPNGDLISTFHKNIEQEEHMPGNNKKASPGGPHVLCSSQRFRLLPPLDVVGLLHNPLLRVEFQVL